MVAVRHVADTAGTVRVASVGRYGRGGARVALRHVLGDGRRERGGSDAVGVLRGKSRGLVLRESRSGTRGCASGAAKWVVLVLIRSRGRDGYRGAIGLGRWEGGVTPERRGFLTGGNAAAGVRSSGLGLPILPDGYKLIGVVDCHDGHKRMLRLQRYVFAYNGANNQIY